MAETLIVSLAPALTGTLAACDWLDGVAVTSQPAGPWLVRAKVRSSEVSFVSVTVNRKVVLVGPWRDGKSEVIVTEPAADSLTRTEMGRMSVSPPEEATIVIG